MLCDGEIRMGLMQLLKILRKSSAQVSPRQSRPGNARGARGTWRALPRHVAEGTSHTPLNNAQKHEQFLTRQAAQTHPRATNRETRSLRKWRQQFQQPDSCFRLFNYNTRIQCCWV